MLVRSLKEQRDLWLKLHPLPWSFKDHQEYAAHLFSNLDRWLDNGYGSRPLRQPGISQVVVDSLLHFDRKRYYLDEFVIMPNHVHLLALLKAGYSLRNILHSWKSFTGGEINRLLGRRGTFWLHESFDRIVRSWEDLEHFRWYIRNNPIKAGLSESEYIVGRGSGIRRG